MGWMPEGAERLLEVALVGELTVIGRDGRPISHPLIPLYDGERIYLHSSTLFSKKLEHIKANPKVALSLSDPIAMKGVAGRATIQGTARVVGDDPHTDWERLILDLWRAKEPAINGRTIGRIESSRSGITSGPSLATWPPREFLKL